MILGTGHDRSADMWTLGVLAYECRVAATPFDAPRLSDAEKAGLTAEQVCLFPIIGQMMIKHVEMKHP